MPDVLSLLPPFEWRGVKYPVTARNVSFAHDSADHSLQYRDNAIVEQLGAKNPTFSYTIPMRQDIAKGPYKDLFVSGLPALFRDMRNREEGPLVDPVYGPFTCVPTSYTDDTDVNKRDGTDIRVEFKLSPSVDEDQQIEPPTLQGVLAASQRMDGDLPLADWHQEPSPEGTTDLFSAINGLIAIGPQTIDRVNGSVNDVAARVEKVETTIDRLPDPKNWPLRASARRVRGDIVQLRQSTARAVVRFASPLPAVAQANGVTVEVLLALNPTLAANPNVPAGTRIRLPPRGQRR